MVENIKNKMINKEILCSVQRKYLPSNPLNWANAGEEWHVHDGTGCIYIVGPGPESMMKCSEYSWTNATEEERRIAELAVVRLNKIERNNFEAGDDVIKRAIEYVKNY